MQDNQLSKYLKSQGIKIGSDYKEFSILNNKDAIEGVAIAWNTHKKNIRMVVQAKCDKIREEMLLNAPPESVISLRQSLADLGGVLEMFEDMSIKYSEQKKQSEKSDED